MSDIRTGEKRTVMFNLTIFIFLGLVGTAFLAVLYIYNPAVSSIYPKCVFYELTGLYCPGCGGTRAIHSLLHGHLLDALGHNVLTITALPFLIYAILSSISGYLPGKPEIRLKLSSTWIYAIFWGILAFWIVRNIPVFPFSLLAP
jgi:uncharacterized protein DUF2752